MIESIVVKAGFITCKCTIDTDVAGVSGRGLPTKGAVVNLAIIFEKARESKPASVFAKDTLKALKSWGEGDAEVLNELGVEVRGTKFQSSVLHSMRSISFGETKTYRELATMNQTPSAYRAVASVCAKNRVPIIIPCHRVVKSDGSIGEYFYGTELKQQLLDFESHQQLL